MQHGPVQPLQVGGPPFPLVTWCWASSCLLGSHSVSHAAPGREVVQQLRVLNLCWGCSSPAGLPLDGGLIVKAWSLAIHKAGPRRGHSGGRRIVVSCR